MGQVYQPNHLEVPPKGTPPEMKAIPRASLLLTIAALAACEPSQPSAEYLAVCEGQPLGSAERRNQALEDGYDIDRQFDCITKQSARLLAEQEAQRRAANTPEAKAAREAEFARRAQEDRVAREAQMQAAAEARAERERQLLAAIKAPVESVEINSATEAQLANLQGLGANVARNIVAERAKARFTGWGDVVRRITGLSAAETAVRASAFGLTVNGLSLEGAEPDSLTAQQMRANWLRRGR